MVGLDMSTLVLIDEEAVSLRYYPKTQIVHHELRQFVHGAKFREVLERGLELFETYGACKWLSDNRGNGPVKPADAEWALNDWAPRVIAAGWKFWAVVMPDKVMGQMNMKRRIATYEELGVTSQPFTDPDAALRWLIAQRRV